MKWFFHSSIFLKERNSHWAHLSLVTGVLSSSVAVVVFSTTSTSSVSGTLGSASPYTEAWLKIRVVDPDWIRIQ
jgi:hypothetical protein